METADAMDLISELPTFIIHHIMSYLSAEEVARTGILSKRWNQIRTSFPILDLFNYPLILPRGLNDRNFYLWKEREERGQRNFSMVKFLDASLVRFCKLKLIIQKLTLRISRWDVEGSSSLVHKWIGLAVENGVKEIYFSAVQGHAIDPYTLPQTIFSAKLLTTLKLATCRLELPLNAISLNSLKNLYLRRVSINDQMMQKLIDECRLLEDLYLSGCLHLKYLSVPKAHKLKNLTIEDCPTFYLNLTIEDRQSFDLESVVAPSLQQLILDEFFVAYLLCPNLKVLTLCGLVLKDQEFHQLISKFPLLEDLSVIQCSSIERIKISGDLLKNLLFESSENLKSLDLDTPNLLSFTFGSPQIPTVSMNTAQLCSWKVNLGLDADIRWYLKLKDFLGASNQTEKLVIAVYENVSKMPLHLEELKKGSPSLPHQVGTMSLHMELLMIEYKNCLDGLFWICYPKTLLLPTMSKARPQFVEWLFEQLRNRSLMNCCRSCDIKCWRHYLKDIKMVSFLPYGGEGRPIKIENWRDRLPILPKGYVRLPNGHFTLNLEWSFPVLIDDKS